MTAHCNTERRVNQRSLTERPPRKPESSACQDQFEFLGVEYTPARFSLERLQFDIHRIAPPENPKGRLHRDAGGTILFARQDASPAREGYPGSARRLNQSAR